jgi:hypothetical protein
MVMKYGSRLSWFQLTFEMGNGSLQRNVLLVREPMGD